MAEYSKSPAAKNRVAGSGFCGVLVNLAFTILLGVWAFSNPDLNRNNDLKCCVSFPTTADVTTPVACDAANLAGQTNVTDLFMTWFMVMFIVSLCTTIFSC